MRREFALPEERPVIVMTEEMPYPQERAWVARYEPLYLAQWWRPRGYSNPIVESDLFPGGRWRIVQRDPEGNEFAFYGKYDEVDPMDSVVQTFVSELFPHLTTRITTEFTATARGTLVVTTHDLLTETNRRGYVLLGALGRMTESSENYNRLLAQLLPR